MTHAGMVTTHP